MNSAPWDAPDSDDDLASQDRPAATLVSLHFIRFALRRRWLACVMSAVVGLVAAAAFLVTFPAAHDAKATLVLAHQPGEESSKAMATDESLLKTRTLAARVIENLGLTMTPDDFLKTVTAEAVSPELLSVTLTAPSNAEAIRRLEALTSIYLDFRGHQMSMQSNVYVEGLQQRIKMLQSEVAGLSLKVEQLSSGGSSSASKLSDAVSQRAFIQGRIDTLQQEAESVTLQTTSVAASSRVIDPAAIEAHAAKRRVALTLASGLIGGATLGCGAVLFFAITSDRLRRRSDVAAALELPVPVSVGRIAPVSERWLRVPHVRTLDRRCSHERQRLAHAIEMELPMPRRWGRIAVACIDNADEVRFGVAAAAADLAGEGLSTTLIDLTEQGSLVELAPSATGSPDASTVLRPRGVPTLAGGPGDLRAVGADHDEDLASLAPADVTIVLADLDPSVGADHLAAWTDRVIIAVTAGRSSAERVRTAADLVRTAGLELRFAALLRTERADESSGTAGFDRLMPIHLVDEHDQPQYAAESADEEWDATNAPAIADQQQPADEDPTAALQNEIPEDQAAIEDQVGAEEQAHDEELIGALQEQISEDGSPDEGQIRGEEQTTAFQEQIADQQQLVDHQQASDEHPVAEEQTTTAPHEATADEQAPDEDQIGAPQNEVPDDQVAAEEQLAAEEQIGGEEQIGVFQELLADHEKAPDEGEAPDLQQEVPGSQASDEDQTTFPQEQVAEQEEATADDDQIAAVEKQLPDKLARNKDQATAPHEQSVNQEQATADQQQPADEDQIATLQNQVAEEQAPDQEQPRTRQEEVAEKEQTADQEQPVALEKAEGTEPGPEYPLVSAAAAPSVENIKSENEDWNLDDSHSEQHSAVTATDTEAGLVPELDPMVGIPPENDVGDGWPLYVDQYPPAYARSGSTSEDEELNWDWDWDLDDVDSNEDSAAVTGADEQAPNGEEHRSAPEIQAIEEARDEAERPTGKRATSNGRGPQKTRTRNRRSRARSSRK